MRRFNQYINKNIGRKLTFLMVPVLCIVMTVTILLTSWTYTRRLVKNIEEGSQYITETFKLNMDFCTSDVKALLNTLSMDENVIRLVTMEQDSLDYGEFLSCQRELKKRFGSMTSMKSYIQDVFVLGNNGYQYNYLQNIRGSLMETDWFQECVDKEKKGFQYILPHDVDYYETGKTPASQAISVVLPIRSGNETVGYTLCDIRMNKAAVLPESIHKDANMNAYLVNGSTKEYYDFQTKQNHTEGTAEFIRYLGDKKSDSLRADDHFIIYSKMESSDWYIAAVYLYKDIIASAVSARRIGFIMLLLGCGAVAVLSRVIAGSVKRPIDEIICRIQQVEQENFEPVEVTGVTGQPGELVLIRGRFEEMIRRINELVHKVYLGEIYRKNMEYENLVNQVNPHFIFNVLQLIQAKAVLSENYEIEEIVVSLSRMMRYTMSNKDKIVTLKEECSHVESYLELYKQRYSHKFSYEIHLEKELELHPILKFVIQPLAENCMKHGFKKLKREGRVVIDVSRLEEQIRIMVEDDGNGIEAGRLEELRNYISDTEDRQFSSIGLKNTFQRLKLTYGDKAEMKIESVENQYTKVCITVPREEIHV